MKKLAIALLTIAGLIILTPMCLYWWGLSNLEFPPKPSALQLTSDQELALWDKLNESDPLMLKKTSPYGYLAYLSCAGESKCESKYPGLRASARAVRSQVSSQLGVGNNSVWQLTWAAYTIWVTRNWTIHQVLATYQESLDP